jgi:ABC-2 type transport system permease protein
MSFARCLPMVRWWSAALGLVRASIQISLTYRARLAFLLSSALFPLLLLFVWLTVAAESSTPAGWNSTRFVSYYVAAALVNEIASSSIVWSWDADLRSGELSSKMLRPVPVVHQYIASEAGSKVVSGGVMVVLSVVASVTLSMVDFRADVVSMAGATAATVIAFFLASLMASTFCLIGFWSTQSSNVYLVWWGLGAFVSGWVAPSALMPRWLSELATYLPFRYTLGFPVEIALGISSTSLALGFTVAAGWTLAFAGAYSVLWHHGIRRFQAVGG